MNNQDKKFKDLHDALLGCCLVFVILFFFNHNFSKHHEHAKPGKHQEYISSPGNSIISENNEIKIYKPFHCLSIFPEFKSGNSIECEQKQISILAKDFLQIKILLKTSRYNLYFASGFHEPHLVA